jgi:hypothetical protein
VVGFGLKVHKDQRTIENSNSHYVGTTGGKGLASSLGGAHS